MYIGFVYERFVRHVSTSTYQVNTFLAKILFIKRLTLIDQKLDISLNVTENKIMSLHKSFLNILLIECENVKFQHAHMYFPQIFFIVESKHWTWTNYSMTYKFLNLIKIDMILVIGWVKWSGRMKTSNCLLYPALL